MAKPITAFVLCLTGGMIYSIIGAIDVVESPQASSVKALSGISNAPTLVAIWGGIGVACGLLMIFGSLLMNREDRSGVRTGAILVLVFAIVGAVFTLGGFVIGCVLALIGSIIYLKTKGPEPVQIPPATTAS